MPIKTIQTALTCVHIVTSSAFWWFIMLLSSTCKSKRGNSNILNWILRLNQKEFVPCFSLSSLEKSYQDYHYVKGKIRIILIDLVEGSFVILIGQGWVSTLPK